MALRELSASPSLRPLFGKAVATGFTKHGGSLPDTVYALSGVRIDPAHLADYARVCGFRVSDEPPATYPHLLGFPLQLKLLTDHEFPFPLIGSVHIANRITVRRRLRLDERLDLRVHAERLRDHPRGRQFDVVTEAFVDGVGVWTDVSTYLRRGAGGGAESGSSSKEAGESGPSSNQRHESHIQHNHPTAVWRVPKDIGRRYAAVSGDANPIHLHPLAAKAFGFRRAIAHGMWTQARCLAGLEGRLPSDYTVDVRFAKPVLLPATVAFFTEQTADGWHFWLHARDGKPHLAGTATR